MRRHTFNDDQYDRIDSTGGGSNRRLSYPLLLPLTASLQGMAVHGGGIPTGTSVSNTPNVTAVTPTQVTIALHLKSQVDATQNITFQGYWSTAHPGNASNPTDGAGNSRSGNNVSRDFIYNYEITNGLVNTALQAGPRALRHAALSREIPTGGTLMSP